MRRAAAHADPAVLSAELRAQCALGSSISAKKLISAGADVNAPDPETGRPPLLVAVAHGHKIILKTLIAAGADLLARDAAGNSVVHLAAAVGSGMILRDLLEAGAPINDVNPVTGATPLIAAVQALKFPLVRELLLSGGDRTIRDLGGRTAADYAAGTPSAALFSPSAGPSSSPAPSGRLSAFGGATTTAPGALIAPLLRKPVYRPNLSASQEIVLVMYFRPMV